MCTLPADPAPMPNDQSHKRSRKLFHRRAWRPGGAGMSTTDHLADGPALVRVSGRENAQTKGRRTSLRRVTVRYAGPRGIPAYVRGQGEIYRVEHPWDR